MVNPRCVPSFTKNVKLGHLPLLMLSVQPLQSGFSQTNNCGTVIAAGANCQINITFNPTVTGQSGASLIIEDNSPINNYYQASLLGYGSDFELNVTTPSATVTAGQTATYPFTVQGIDGFAGTVALSCSGAPKEATCTVSPSSVTIVAGQTPAFTASVTTTAQTTSLLIIPNGTRPGLGRALAGLVGGVLLGSIILSSCRCTRMAAVLPIFMLLLMCSCGGSSTSTTGGTGNTGGGGGGGGTTSGTPSGNYTLTVTATDGGLSHTVPLGLTIN